MPTVTAPPLYSTMMPIRPRVSQLRFLRLVRRALHVGLVRRGLHVIDVALSAAAAYEATTSRRGRQLVLERFEQRI